MVDDLVNANDREDTRTVVKNPYIKNKPSVTYEEVQAAARRKSTNATSSKSNGSNKPKRMRRQTTHQVRAQVEECRKTKERNRHNRLPSMINNNHQLLYNSQYSVFLGVV